MLSLISQASNAHYLDKKAKVEEVKVVNYSAQLRAASKEILNEVLDNLNIINSPGLRILKKENVALLFSESKSVIDECETDIHGLKEQYNNLLLAQDKQKGWLTDYFNQKDISEAYFCSQRHNTETPEHLDSVINQHNTSLQEAARYDEIEASNLKKIKSHSLNTELLAITSYMEVEFSGFGPPEQLRETLSIIFDRLKTLTKGLLFSNEHIDLSERLVIAAHLSKQTNTHVSGFCSGDALFRPNLYKYWNQDKETVKNILKYLLPKLRPSKLSALLQDEDADIIEPIKFTGFSEQESRERTFSQRMHPKTLRYDIQEQGSDLRDLIAGAIVAHYHSFLACKQGAYITEQVYVLSDKILNKQPANLEERLIKINTQASLYTHNEW
ncbi:MAG: hypothetical protein ACI936_000026 [Paraglaciecola sp.]|jgi:hypothetical protein